MASSICHAFAGTKRFRLERTVRLHARKMECRMLAAILLVYAWAGATTAMAVVQFAEIRRESCGLLPEDDELRRSIEDSVVAKPGLVTIMVIVTIWPVVLPAWIVARIRSAA